MHHDAPTEPTPIDADTGRKPNRPSLRSCVIVGIAIGALLTIAPFDGLFWHVASNFRAQATVILAGCVAVSLARRRWIQVLLLSVVGGAVFFVGHMPRAARQAGEAPAATQTVRVLHFNIYSYNTRLDDILALFDASGADVVSIMETPKALTEQFRTDPALAERWPHRFLPEERWAGLPLILSRWPIETDPSATGLAERVLGDRTPGAIVTTPNGEFLLAQVHPMSPRTPGAVQDGDTILREQAEQFHRARATLRLPIIIAADLNGAPMSRRGHMLHNLADVRPAKKQFEFSGSWPAWAPGPLRISIDDFWVSDDVRIISRRRLPATGSDHVPILVELSLPAVRRAMETPATPPGDD